MATWVVFALIGLGVGSVYASLAVGLVVTYKGTGVINVAAGALALWGAYVYSELRTTGDLVFPIIGVPDRIHLADSLTLLPGLAIGLTSSALVGVLVHMLVFRPLVQAPILAKVVATVGLFISMQALIALKFGTDARILEPILPDEPISLGAVSVNRDRLFLAGTAATIGIVLAGWFRWSRTGLAVVAAAEDERAASLAGYSPQRLAVVTWMIATTVTTMMIVLTAPTTNLNIGSYSIAVVPALAVALLGRLTSLSVSVAAGLSLGALQSVVTYAKTTSWFPDWAEQGVSDVLPFLLIVVTLFVLGRTLPDRGTDAADAMPGVRFPRNRPVMVVACTAAAAALVMSTDGSWRFAVITSLIGVLLALSLVLLTGLVGQISLAQAAFAGAAGFALSKIGHGLPFPLSVLAAASVAAVLGVLVGIPALRIRGAQLAVVTLAAAVAIEQFVFRNPRITPAGGNLIPDPTLFGVDLGVREGSDIARVEFGLTVLAIVVVAALVVANLMRSATGRRFLTVRSNERAGTSLGIDVVRVKLVAFALSSFLAGVAGALLGYSRGQLSPASFGTSVGLTLLAFAYLGGITSVSGAIVAGTMVPLGLVYQLNVRWIGAHIEGFDDVYHLLSGIALVATAIYNPMGIAGAVRERLDRLRRTRVDALAPAPRWPAVARRERTTGDLLLRATGVGVSYGGLRAVDDVELEVRAGQIVGLIGPNGAGKTTFIDAITGFVPADGAVTLRDQDLTDRQAHERATGGLVRTWQSLELFDELTVRENVAVATAPSGWRAIGLDIVRPGRVQSTGDVDRALDLLGLTADGDAVPSTLPLGRQKLVGVARALSMRPSVLVLDEPASGLSTGESRQLGDALDAIAADGVAVLLVDHDMGLVLELCDDLYVLELGRVIAHGSPADVRIDPVVVTAYLGGTAELAPQ